MTVHELSQDELEELVVAYWGEVKMTEGNINDITLDEVKKHYEGTTFVKDDFFCNL